MKMKSNSYEIEMVCMTHTGHIRVHNEDNISFDGFYLPEEHQSIEEPMLCRLKGGSCAKAAVFDGMGGENRGELASYIAAKMLTEEIEEGRWTRENLFRMVENLNHEVCRAGAELKIGRMGTTAAILALNPGEVWVCNVGDSPIYLYRNGKLKMLSHMHTNAEFLDRQGITWLRPGLTQFLGMDEEFVIEPYIEKQIIRKGDIYLVCSDGVTDMMTEKEIADVLEGDRAPEEYVEMLVGTALEHGGKDNITVIFCRIV